MHAAGHNYIGTEHILLGLLREGEGVAARVLETLGADPSKIRTQVAPVLLRTMLSLPARNQCHICQPAPSMLTKMTMTSCLTRRYL